MDIIDSNSTGQINCPKDPELLTLLQGKLKDYNERMGEYSHPDAKIVKNRDAYFKALLLKNILETGSVSISEIAEKIKKEYPDYYDAMELTKAWAVVFDYCYNDGKNTINSITGKPGIEISG